MSQRDQFPKPRHGLYINGILVEDLDGYYYENVNIGIPDGCYSDGEALSQIGSVLFIMSHGFTAFGIVGPTSLSGRGTMFMSTGFTAYGVATPPRTVLPLTIHAHVAVSVEVERDQQHGWGQLENVIAMYMNVRMEGL